MKLSPKVMAVAVVLVICLGIGIAMVSGAWNPGGGRGTGYSRGQGNGQGGQGSGYGRQALTGATVTPDDIRGSSTLSEISQAFGIPVADLTKAFAIDSLKNAPNMASRDIKELYAGQNAEVGNGSIKWFVALYKKIPFQLNEETFLPQPAVDMLKVRGLPAEQLRYVEAHIVKALVIK